jgi:hypothetical protein
VPCIRQKQNKNLRQESVWPPLLTYFVFKQFVKLFLASGPRFEDPRKLGVMGDEKLFFFGQTSE